MLLIMRVLSIVPLQFKVKPILKLLIVFNECGSYRLNHGVDHFRASCWYSMVSSERFPVPCVLW
jgi:hypothetical protein